MRIRYAAYTTAGYIRDINEDNLYLQGITKPVNRANFRKNGTIKGDAGLFAVCDGLGGEGNGERASAIAVECMKEYQNSFVEDYQEYLDNANDEICDRQKDGKMGCTIAALAFQGEKMIAANLGDSRIYYINGNSMKQITTDHSEFEIMKNYGMVKEEDYYTSSLRNSLTRHLGSKGEKACQDPGIYRDLEVKQNDIFLLCSDGLCGVLKPEQMLKIILQKGSLRKCCVDLVKAALSEGSEDNITAILVQVL